MPKPRTGKPAQITFEQAIAELPDAEAKLRAESTEYARAYEQCITELHRLHGIMARERARHLQTKVRVDQLRAVIDRGDGEGRPAVVYRSIPNPYITQGLIDAVASDEVETKHEASQMAAMNLTLLVGGLARVRNKTELQTAAAIRYSNLHDRSQIGGARAVDYSKERVDTSGPKQDALSASQDDARAELAGARKVLGVHHASIVDAVVIGGESIRTVAKRLGNGQSGSGRRKAEAALLDALDVLVDYFAMQPNAQVRQRRWSDGSRARILRDLDGLPLAYGPEEA
ncbi:hypothetical protein GCM10007989_05100 [Devosia pacifica]|uniref:Uncharacterized protein n=1 Tax=Devosia pacifica TaxID=1335967 RepID=A0A918RUS1_9HYPH|nr:hypothetical protein [Devosia pacifica]GHA13479.1 hypothetical protein GCM10007989_05100 [Devosia pacifica]